MHIKKELSTEISHVLNFAKLWTGDMCEEYIQQNTMRTMNFLTVKCSKIVINMAWHREGKLNINDLWSEGLTRQRNLCDTIKKSRTFLNNIKNNTISTPYQKIILGMVN